MQTKLILVAVGLALVLAVSSFIYFQIRGNAQKELVIDAQQSQIENTEALVEHLGDTNAKDIDALERCHSDPTSC